MSENIMPDLSTEIKAVAQDLASIKEAVNASKATAEEVEKVKAELADALERAKASEKAAEVIAQDVAEMRKATTAAYGPSGAKDYAHEFGAFIQAAHHVKTKPGAPLPDHLKARADYVTTTDAQGGIFVPTLLDPMIREIIEVHGKLWPYLRKITVPAGQAIEVPYDSTLPTMTWRTTQGADMTEDAGPIGFGDDDLRPALLHDYVAIANELLESSVINIGEVFATRMISKGIRAIEAGILVGNDSSTHPHDGIIQISNDSGDVNTQSALATPTFALVANFIGECIADAEGSADTSAYQLITTPAVANVLASEAVGASELTGMLTWGDPRSGVPGRLMGYDFLTHPSCVSTTNRMILAPLGNITVAWTGGFAVDFNPYGYASSNAEGWVANETLMKVQTHADYGLGNQGEISEATVTALSA